MNQFLKILSVFITCFFFFGKVGIPTAVMLFKFDFWKVILVSSSAAIVANITFTNLSATFIKWRHKYRVKNNLVHRKKIFTKFNRRIIRIKQRFGLVGIAFITPIIGMPLGAFIAERFFKDKKKVIVYLSISAIFWGVALYSMLYLFHDTFKNMGWLD